MLFITQADGSCWVGKQYRLGSLHSCDCWLLRVLTFFGVVSDSQVENKLLRLGTNRMEEIRQDLISSSQLLVQLLVSISPVFLRCTFYSARS